MHPMHRREGGHPRPRHHHPRHPGHPGLHDGPPHRRGGGRGRAPRGDVRTAILLLLAEQPMHGYQLMQAIGDRSGGGWTPSPGAVYPAISLLEDEGLVTVAAEGGRKLVTLTDAGREQLAEHRESWGDPFAGFDATSAGPDLRRLVHDVHEATRQIGRAGNDEQRATAAKLLTETRRALYLLLADGGEEPADA